MDPSLRLVELVHATQRLGATLVLVNPRLAAPEIAALLAHTAPALVLHDRGTAPPPCGVATTEAEAELDRAPVACVPPGGRIDPARVLTVLATSGTTGRPKGVMLTSGNHEASAAASRARLGTRADDRWLCCLPLHHVGGLSIVVRSVLDGVPLVLVPRFEPAAVWAALRRHRVTLLSLVPTMLHRLLAAGEVGGAPALRAVLVGGAALDPALHARARAAGLPVLPTYGLTEAASQVATAALDDPAAAGVGRPLPATRVRIAAPDAHGVGEVLVAGPTVMAGYFRDPAATDAVLRDGWLHTGDVGRLDAAGRLEVLDRRADLIVSGGENVYPTEVERVLLAHPAVTDAAVYGTRDEEWGRRVTAAVVLDPTQRIDETALRDWCRARLAPFKVPRTITAVAALPRTPSGKLRRHALGA
jgi:O-succinylbenzoic acid--CoA ligase